MTLLEVLGWLVAGTLVCVGLIALLSMVIATIAGTHLR